MTQGAVALIRTQTTLQPRCGVVLGSGLGAFAESLEDRLEIPYRDLPGFPVSTAVGHAGVLVLGRLAGMPLAVLSGRVHLYEGYTARQAAFGTLLLHGLGVRSLVLTNAAGAINTAYERGSLVLISDHINLQGQSPLTGPNDEALGPRFPDMTEAYLIAYRETAKQIAREQGFRLPEGVYAALPGPSYETPAEIRYLRAIGADLVGMSTVPETIMANYLGMRVLAFSCVTNMAAGVRPEKLHHEEVLATGQRVQAQFLRFLTALLPNLEDQGRG